MLQYTYIILLSSFILFCVFATFLFLKRRQYEKEMDQSRHINTYLNNSKTPFKLNTVRSNIILV